MLTKLLKHEFRATARIMGPLYLVLLAVALGFNFSARLMDTSNVVLNILAALVILAYVAAIIGVFIVAFILMLQRFYKNLLGDEGYIMFTLPASVHQQMLLTAAEDKAGVIASGDHGIACAQHDKFHRSCPFCVIANIITRMGEWGNKKIATGGRIATYIKRCHAGGCGPRRGG